MMETLNSKFIVFEGIECSGKSTNIKLLKQYFEHIFFDVVFTREPGGTNEGEKIRNILLTENLNKETELLLMFASRAQHVENIIIPALKKDKFVVCDRFTDSTYAYQGGGRGIENRYIECLEDLTQGSLRPSLTFILDIPASVSMERLENRKGTGDEIDRIEKEKYKFFERARNTYLERARLNPQRYIVVDATQPIEKVQEILRTSLLEFYFKSSTKVK